MVTGFCFVIFRDLSANKCGVIASSYEVLANLLMNDDEFKSMESDSHQNSAQNTIDEAYSIVHKQAMLKQLYYRDCAVEFPEKFEVKPF